MLQTLETELTEIQTLVTTEELAEEERDLLWHWIANDGERLRESAHAFVERSDAYNAVRTVAAASAFQARLGSIATTAARAAGSAASSIWQALTTKVQSALSQIWSLISSLGTVSDWTLTGEVGMSVLGLGKASVAIKFV